MQITLDLLERVVTYLLANVANSFSGPNLVKYIKNEKRTLSLETIYNYIAYAREACLLHLIPRIDVQKKSLLKFQEKIYLSDQGIRNRDQIRRRLQISLQEAKIIVKTA